MWVGERHEGVATPSERPKDTDVCKAVLHALQMVMKYGTYNGTDNPVHNRAGSCGSSNLFRNPCSNRTWTNLDIRPNFAFRRCRTSRSLSVHHNLCDSTDP